MKKYVLLIVLALCAISALAVAFLGGEKDDRPVSKSIPWEHAVMRSVCYMSVECLTTDFSPVQESIYTNRLMYGELPMSFVLSVDAPVVEVDSIASLSCMVECAGVKLESDLKDLIVEKKSGGLNCSGIFYKDLSPVAKELGEPVVMEMMKVFPKGVKIFVKYQLVDGSSSDYVEVKQ